MLSHNSKHARDHESTASTFSPASRSHLRHWERTASAAAAAAVSPRGAVFVEPLLCFLSALMR